MQMGVAVICPLTCGEIAVRGMLSTHTLERKGVEIMFKTFVIELFHVGRSPKVATSIRRTKISRERIVDLSTLAISAPLTKKEIAAKYKAGRVAEMSEVHASV